MRIARLREQNLVPSRARRISGVVEVALRPGLRQANQRNLLKSRGRFAAPPISEMNSPICVPLACRIFEMLSVLGQRSFPSLVIRLLLLNVVGSRPARLAKPEGDIPHWLCEAIDGLPDLGVLKHGNIVIQDGWRLH